MDEEKIGSSTLQKRRSITLLDKQSDISGYHADIHEGHGTVGSGPGRGMACVNYRTAWQGNGMLCVNRPLKRHSVVYFSAYISR
jgi:hypothetical protein